MDNRRFLLAITLSVGVLLLWGWVFPPPEEAPIVERPAAEESAERSGRDRVPPDRGPEAPPGDTGRPGATSATGIESRAGAVLPGATQAGPAVSPGGQPDVVADRERPEIIENGSFRAEFTNRGAQLTSFRLKEHANSDGEPLDLVRARDARPYPFGLVESGGEPSPLNDALFRVERARADAGDELRFSYRGPAGAASKRFVFGDDGLFEVEITLDDGVVRSVVLGPGIRNPTAKELDNRFARKSAIYKTLDDTEIVDPKGHSEVQFLGGDNLRWVGLQDTYFLTALVFRAPVDQVVLEPVLGKSNGAGEPMLFRRRPAELSGEEEDLIREIEIQVRPQAGRLEAMAFWGPKIYDDLAAQGLGLEESVALGPFKLLARPLLAGVRWIHDRIVSNYGWAIILMTLAIRIVLFPLNHKSVVSMQRMQKVNPKIQAIRQKYRSKLKDKQGRPNPEMQRKQNEEIMALYKKEGVNPAGGCLPMLLQIPVLFAFYSLLSTAIELRGAPWVGWIHDLSAPDPFLVLPLVMGATQFLQQKLTPSAADPTQRRIFMLMPVFFTILFLGFPSGLVLYWLTNNVLGIAQQVAYQRFKKDNEAEA